MAGSASLLGLVGSGAYATVLQRAMPWAPNAGAPPNRVVSGGWLFFSNDEAAIIEALVDHLIPPDPQTPGGKDAGCAVFIDRQLAGGYGSSDALYMSGPFINGTARQGDQSPLTPAARYKQAIPAISRHLRDQFAGKPIDQLSDTEKDDFLKSLESGALTLPNVDGKGFFKQLLKDTQEGFFSDPLYGGNRGMVAWKMIGFPGARYDFRDWVDRHNERYPLPPVGIYDL